jgi:hypothetical protein
MVDMAHNRDYRGAGVERFGKIFFAAQTHLDIGLGDPPQAVPELAHDEFGSVGVDGLINRRHHPHAHQRLDHICAALGHPVCQLLNGDRLGDDDLADDLDLLLLALVQTLALALPSPADRSQAAHPLSFVVGECTGDRDLSGAATRLFATSGHHRFFGLRPSPPSRRRRRPFFLFFKRNADLACGGKRRDFCRGRLPRPFGDFAPRFFVFASLGLLLGSLASLLFGAPSSLFLFRFSVRFLLGPTPRLLCGLLFCLPAPVGFGKSSTSVCFFVGFAGIVHRADATRLFFRG